MRKTPYTEDLSPRIILMPSAPMAFTDILARVDTLPEPDPDFWAKLLDIPKADLVPNFENEKG